MRFSIYRPLFCYVAAGIGISISPSTNAQAERQLEPVVVSASRMEQKAFDASASISSIQTDPFHATSPLVNLSELTSTVPGMQVRDRQNFAQDLQLSIRGFGTRSTFGVRGVRLLIDGIPATMPDGQGQAATANLASIRRIEVLRGPLATLYGNAAGGVVQMFTQDPLFGAQPMTGGASIGYGSDNQRQASFSLGLSGEQTGGLLDLFHYRTDGYRDHSAAERTQLNGKVKWRSADTTVTGILNVFDQPLAQDPLGLTRAQFEQNPRRAVPAAFSFNTRKSVEQQQAGLLVEQRLNERNLLNARVYAGTRSVWQALGFSGVAATSSGGIVDLDNAYWGIGASWTHAGRNSDLPWNFTMGFEADSLDQQRRGYVNAGGRSGELRRDEKDQAENVDLFAQADWMLVPSLKGSLGARFSHVKFSINDRYVTASSPDDSGSVTYQNASPVLGLTWFAADNLNLYANIGKGFETPTLAETAYRADASGPNLQLDPSRSLQAEAGLKWRSGKQSLDMALFAARSRDEIVPQLNQGGRTIFQNVDDVERNGFELSWRLDEKKFSSQIAYTWLHARFRESFMAGEGRMIAAGNRLPGVPMHSFFSQLDYKPAPGLSAGIEMRVDSKTYVDDLNSDSAPGYAIFNLRAGKEFHSDAARWTLFGRIDNLLNRDYAGSVIVNEGNGRFFESAAGRRFFIGLRASL